MSWRQGSPARLALALVLASALAGCGGDIAPQASAPRPALRPAVTAAAELAKAARAPLSIGYVEYQGMHAYAAVHVLLELEQLELKNPALEVQAAGRTLGRIALARPVTSSTPYGMQYGTRHWSATIPPAWAIKGASWRAVADNHDASAPRTLTLAD